MYEHLPGGGGDGDPRQAAGAAAEAAAKADEAQREAVTQAQRETEERLTRIAQESASNPFLGPAVPASAASNPFAAVAEAGALIAQHGTFDAAMKAWMAARTAADDEHAPHAEDAGGEIPTEVDSADSQECELDRIVWAAAAAAAAAASAGEHTTL